MSDKIPLRCVETGNGVAVWEAQLPTQGAAMGVSEAAELVDTPTYDTVTLYCPVIVDINDDGEPYAFAYADYDHPALEFPSDGKVYVQPRYIHVTPPSNAQPAFKFGVNAPGEMISVEDVPDEYHE